LNWLERFLNFQGLFHRQLAAGMSDDVLCGGGFNKLKTVAEGIPLTNKRVDLDRSQWQRKFEPNNFSNRNLIPQHDCNAGPAHVDRASSHYNMVARINAYLHIEPETGMAAIFDQLVSLALPKLIAHFHFDISGTRGRARRHSSIPAL
jgi:hypothetical protein